MDNNTLRQAALIPTLETLFVPFSAATNQPFITTHAEDATDQVWIFVTEDQCRAFCKQRFEEVGDPVRVIKVQHNDTLHFFSTLYFLGVDEIVFVEEKDMTRMALTSLVKKPNFDDIPEGQRPLFNPGIQLSGLRLMQEVHRRGDVKPMIRDLEDEMIANLMRARFILVTAMLEEGEDPATHDNKAIPCIQDKEGKKYQPIFTDTTELAKFTGNRKFKAVTTTFTEVSKMINSDVNGIVVNPHAMNIIFTSEKIPALLEAYKPEEK